MFLKTNFEIHIVEAIVKKRKASKKSQENIADLLKVTVGYIGQIESKKSKSMYNIRQLNKIAIFLQCSPKDFMPDQGIIDEEENTAVNSTNQLE